MTESNTASGASSAERSADPRADLFMQLRRCEIAFEAIQCAREAAGSAMERASADATLTAAQVIERWKAGEAMMAELTDQLYFLGTDMVRQVRHLLEQAPTRA